MYDVIPVQDVEADDMPNSVENSMVVAHDGRRI